MRRFAFTGFLVVTASVLGAATVAHGQLVSYWSFDESNGPALDTGGGNNNGTLGPAVARVPGAIGSGALSFDDSVDSWVNTGPGGGGNYLVTNGITIEALVKLDPFWNLPNSSGNNADYIFYKDGPDPAYHITNFGFQKDNFTTGFPAQTLVFGFGASIGSSGFNFAELDMPIDGVGTRPSLASLQDGNYHYFAGTYDVVSGLKAIYVDGVLAMSRNYAPGTPIATDSISDAIIGNAALGAPLSLHGAIDEVTFYRSALSATDISNRYQNVLAGRNYFNGPPVSIPGDINSDGLINLTDYGILKGHWLQQTGPAGASVGDLNSDGTVNITDFAIFKTYYLSGGGANLPAAVPEPGTLALVFAGSPVLYFLLRRKKQVN